MVGAPSGPTSASISSGVLFNDTAGRPLHAHGAGIVPPDSHPAGEGGKFYMVGTSRKLPPSWLSEGVNLYSSYDLEAWRFEATIFRTAQVAHLVGKAPARVERPKILYNGDPQSRHRYVMWFHLDDAAFSLGFVGVATAKSITGPYSFLAGWRPDGQRSLDMTVFIEPRAGALNPARKYEPAAAWLARSVDNRYVGFSRLTADMLNTTKEGIVSRGPRCEGVAPWLDSGATPQPAWSMLCSHVTGWHANPAIFVRSDSPSLASANWSGAPRPSYPVRATPVWCFARRRSLFAPVLCSQRRSATRRTRRSRATRSQRTCCGTHTPTGARSQCTWATDGTRAPRARPALWAARRTCGCRWCATRVTRRDGRCRGCTGSGMGPGGGAWRTTSSRRRAFLSCLRPCNKS